MTHRGTTRRRALQLAAALGFASAAGGCSLFRQKLRPVCAEQIDKQDEDKRLAIDVHMHAFNASDLQVKSFISRVAARQAEGGLANLVKYFGSALQEISWRNAPSGASEEEALRAWMKKLEDCGPNELADAKLQVRTAQYQEARNALQDAARAAAQRVGPQALNRSVPATVLTPEQRGLRAIDDLPASLDGFDRQRASTQIDPAEVTIRSGLAFVIEQFQYRYMSALNYLDTYRSADRSVDFVAACLVDYDWWLSGGRSTATSLKDQVEVMSSLAVITGGRVHAFAPFCPLRESAHRLRPTSTFSSLELVKDAIENHGAVGVKLYPPMGFAPLGNSALSVWAGKEWLGEIAKRPDFGSLLDASMRELFRWCSSNHVPIMAHTNLSNGAATDLEALAGFQHWTQALQEFPTLAVNFGHFGGVRSREASANTEGYLRLMSGTSGQSGSRAFADSAYYADLIDAPAALASQLRELFERDHAAAGVLPRRFMFGSDWKMLLLEAHADLYMSELETLLRGLAAAIGQDATSFAENVFARNAADYLGLHRGEPTRQRLDGFYRDRGIKNPIWMAKVDR